MSSGSNTEASMSYREDGSADGEGEGEGRGTGPGHGQVGLPHKGWSVMNVQCPCLTPPFLAEGAPGTGILPSEPIRRG